MSFRDVSKPGCEMTKTAAFFALLLGGSRSQCFGVPITEQSLVPTHQRLAFSTVPHRMYIVASRSDSTLMLNLSVARVGLRMGQDIAVAGNFP